MNDIYHEGSIDEFIQPGTFLFVQTVSDNKEESMHLVVNTLFPREIEGCNKTIKGYKITGNFKVEIEYETK